MDSRLGQILAISIKPASVFGSVEVTLNTPPNPAWWIDSKFRKKGYGQAAVDNLAKLLAGSSEVSEIGKIEYRGQLYVSG